MSVHVDPGVTWTTATTGIGAVGSMGVLGLFFRYVGPWRKQTTDAEAAMREEYRSELASVRSELLAARNEIREVTAKVERNDRRHDMHIEILSQLHSAEIAALRHRLGSEAQSNVGLLATIRAGNPDRMEQAVAIIEADRARREENIAGELTELVKLRASAMDKIEKLRAEG